MNLFILSENQEECVKLMMDKHIIKIILEAAQMLSTNKRILDPENLHEYNDIVYKQTHMNHPVTKWVRESFQNWCWTIKLCEEMHREWQYRYNHHKQHKSFIIIEYLRDNPPPLSNFIKNEFTKFALAMPDEYKTTSPVESYRNYYNSPDKKKIASWKNRPVPEWFI